jgi:hypothetical protein
VIFESSALDPAGAIQTGGVVAVLLTILVTGLKRMWVPGWRYQEVLKERDEWKEIALRSTNLAESLGELRRANGGA